MTDFTLIAPYFYLIARVVCVLTVLLYGYGTIRIMSQQISASKERGFSLIDLLVRQNLARLGILLFLSVSAGYFLSREMVYRPKTTPPAVATPEEREVPEFKPEAPKPKWDEVNGKNKQQNEDARKAFEQLPDGK